MKKIERIKVYNKYGGRCSYCGTDIEYKDMQVDHLFPQRLAHLYTMSVSRKKYGCIGDNIDSFENLMPSCRRCNHYKRAYTLEEFRTLMKSLHKRISSHYINKVAIDYNIITLKPFYGKFYFEQSKIILERLKRM